MTNFRELDKARFFDRIIAEMNGNTEAENEFTGSGSEATVSPLHRDIYTPLVWVPELGEDSEVADHANDEELDGELLEEEELDELDMDVEMDHESELWDRARRFQISESCVEVPTTKMGQQTVHRSAEIIEDSD
jgi:hypothetical protein